MVVPMAVSGGWYGTVGEGSGDFPGFENSHFRFIICFLELIFSDFAKKRFSVIFMSNDQITDPI